MLFINKILKELSKLQLLFMRKLSHEEMRKNYMSTSLRYEIIEPWRVSKMQQVPNHIPKPPYYNTSTPPKMIEEIEIKNNNQIDSMRKSCKLAKHILKQAEPLIKPGVSTDFIDKRIHQLIISNGAYPSPLNYRGFPKSICTSINNVACHGIPDSRPLQKGDILNIDITVYFNGYHGDCSTMFVVMETDKDAQKLINITEQCLNSAIKICQPNENFSSIGNIIEEIANKYEFSIVPAFAGHGIGAYFHGPPDIFHFANDYPGRMQPGMTFTIEPVLSEGDSKIVILEDNWTAVTIDNSRTAQMEHTILITNYSCDVLTA